MSSLVRLTFTLQQIIIASQLLLYLINITYGNEVYREEFETFETLQRRRLPSVQKLRTRYVEFAETEFSRTSFYFPVPFISPISNRLQVIPANTLSQLIRQHIAHNRMKHLSLQNIANNRILQGVQHLTELRQTPFRRWSANNTQSYEEKRRQWKAELKRRLNGHKVPTRVIPPQFTRGDLNSSIQTDREPDNRYFVTYSPKTRIYQVSRRPPPFLYVTDKDDLPEILEEKRDLTITAEPTSESVSETETGEVEHIVLMPISTTQNTIRTTPSPASSIIILQRAQAINELIKEHIHEIAANKPKLNENGKQIMFLDDYEQNQENNEDGEESDYLPTRHFTKEIDVDQKLEIEENNEEFVEDEDEDLFFFKPGVGMSDRDAGEPFRILVHDQGRKMRI